MKTIAQLARIIVGTLFIFSGFVKLVDPIGSQYKFEEFNIDELPTIDNTKV